MRVELLYFPGCPNYETARDSLRRCLGAVGLPTQFDEIDVTASNTSVEYRGWGSPTILVDGVDVAGLVPTQSGRSCRVYGSSGVPSDDAIIALLVAQRDQ